jgi:hypothetical protein
MAGIGSAARQSAGTLITLIDVRKDGSSDEPAALGSARSNRELALNVKFSQVRGTATRLTNPK